MVAFAASLIFGLMLAEQRLSRANERALVAAGAVAPPGDPYWALAITYPGAFLIMSAEGLWRSAHLTPGGHSGPSWAAAGALLFIASKVLKYWAIRTLGTRWSFGVWILPGRSLITEGPYQYVAHPNYIAVMGELVGTAMMMEARDSGPIMIALFGVALAARIRFETRVLAATAGAATISGTSEEKG